MQKNYKILLYNRNAIFFCLLVACITRVQAQAETNFLITPNKFRAIDFTQSFISDSLKLDKGKDFYILKIDTANRQKILSNKMYYYVYASFKNEQKSVFGEDAFKYFGHNDSLAYIYADSLKTVGYDVMVYHTAATSGAKFVERMLEYDPGTISFIMFHESIHRHKNNTQSKLPYIFEEALGDVTGILFSSRSVTTKADKKAHAKFIKINEKIYTYVYKAIKGEISKEECTLKLKKILMQGNSFQTDRFTYEVNNAFLLRYTSYIKYYFLLKDVYKKFGDAQRFYKAMFSLSGTEEEIAKKLEGYLVRPTLDF
jgi:hypothetical protein